MDYWGPKSMLAPLLNYWGDLPPPPRPSPPLLPEPMLLHVIWIIDEQWLTVLTLGEGDVIGYFFFHLSFLPLGHGSIQTAKL